MDRSTHIWLFTLLLGCFVGVISAPGSASALDTRAHACTHAHMRIPMHFCGSRRRRGHRHRGAFAWLPDKPWLAPPSVCLPRRLSPLVRQALPATRCSALPTTDTTACPHRHREGERRCRLRRPGPDHGRYRRGGCAAPALAQARSEPIRGMTTEVHSAPAAMRSGVWSTGTTHSGGGSAN